MYMWSLERMGNAGWIAALIFCAASAVRLARFNVESVRDEGATKGNPYFTGLPTPAAACMMLLPLLLGLQWLGDVVRQPWLPTVMVAITSSLMVSRLPTPSIKYMKLQRQHRILAATVFAGLAALLILWPWATLSVGLIIYVASIPFAVFAHHPRYATRG
jgi:CDP-diacylglycerol--serine O-phosphatidyltransferase